MSSAIGTNSTPRPTKSSQLADVHPPGRGEDLPQARRRARRSGAAGARSPARAAKRTSERDARRARRPNASGRLHELDERREPPPTAPQKKSVAAGPEARCRPGPCSSGRASPRDQVIGSVHCVFRFGPGRAVEERGLQLAPAALEPIHGNAARAAVRVARDRLHAGPHVERRAARVVAADALRGRAAEVQRLAVEVRVRAGGRVDDRMRAVDELELGVAPRRSLGALVLAVADLGRRLRERLRGGRRVEDELDHLPVALVQVVPVVEDVEEPVLQRELARVRGSVATWAYDRRRRSLGRRCCHSQVVAARLERVAGEVEVVVVEPGARSFAVGAILTRSSRPTARAARRSAGRRAR